MGACGGKGTPKEENATNNGTNVGRGEGAGRSSVVTKENANSPKRDGPDELKGIMEEDLDAGKAYSFWWDKTQKIHKTKEFVGKKATLKATLFATLGTGDLKERVRCPQGEEKNEWIAVNTVNFYNLACNVYGLFSQFCTPTSCPSMCAGNNEYLMFEYREWKKPTRVPAKVYIDNMLDWVDEQTNNPALFPVDDGASFPRNFISQVKTIYKRLFRLYAHIYYHHREDCETLGVNPHLNTCFKHFVYFVIEWQLIDNKGLAPLSTHIERMTGLKVEGGGPK